jgi:hypothetical protein
MNPFAAPGQVCLANLPSLMLGFSETTSSVFPLALALKGDGSEPHTLYKRPHSGWCHVALVVRRTPSPIR